jgi:hypothetical protein
MGLEGLLCAGVGVASLGYTAAFHATPIASQHRALITMQQDPLPPELDERQAEFMKARGFVWNAKTRAWGKGNPERTQRLECRSGTRLIKWQGDQDGANAVFIRKATRRFEAAIRDAREEAMATSETDRKIALQIKDRIAQPQAPFVWLGIQLAISAFLIQNLAPSLLSDLVADPRAALSSASVGLAVAPALALLRRQRWQRQPGIEDGDGSLERLLVDSMCGSYALPAPWEWRAEEGQWRLSITLAESIASLNMALFWHDGVQAGVVGMVAGGMSGAGDAFVSGGGGVVGAGSAAQQLAPLFGIVATGLSGVGRCAYFYDPVLDGVPAEVECARRIGQTAKGYYGMTVDDPEVAETSALCTRLLAQEWEANFGVGEGAYATQLGLAFASASACAVAWELGGHTAVAPALALCGAAMGTYLIDPEWAVGMTTSSIDLKRVSARPLK